MSKENNVLKEKIQVSGKTIYNSIPMHMTAQEEEYEKARETLASFKDSARKIEHPTDRREDQDE